MKTIVSTTAGIFWVLVTIEPTIFVGVAAIATLRAIDLIVNGHD
jgi:hypothetical protein